MKNAVIAPDALGEATGRRRLPPDVRVTQILDAALVEFAANGFTAARMDDIAGRSGLSKGGLYAHFKSKDDLFEALLVRSLTPPDLGEVAVARPMAPRELAEWLVDRLHTLLGRPETIATMRLLIAESERVPQLVARWQQEVMQPHLTLLAEILRESGVKDSLAVREPWLAVSPVVHAMMSQLVFGPHHHISLAQYRASHIELLCLLLKSPSASPDQ